MLKLLLQPFSNKIREPGSHYLSLYSSAMENTADVFDFHDDEESRSLDLHFSVLQDTTNLSRPRNESTPKPSRMVNRERFSSDDCMSDLSLAEERVRSDHPKTPSQVYLYQYKIKLLSVILKFSMHCNSKAKLNSRN